MVTSFVQTQQWIKAESEISVFPQDLAKNPLNHWSVMLFVCEATNCNKRHHGDVWMISESER